jgi:hypothetical protein
MDTTHGEPDWVNWSQQTWAIEELKQDAITVGEMISHSFSKAAEDVSLHEETWATFYDQVEELEQFHHDFLSLLERGRRIGIMKG